MSANDDSEGASIRPAVDFTLAHLFLEPDVLTDPIEAVDNNINECTSSSLLLAYCLVISA
jgi:hypothetical protein